MITKPSFGNSWTNLSLTYSEITHNIGPISFQIKINHEVRKMALKKFVCQSINPDLPCQFSLISDENKIIQQAVDHELEEHGYQDSPTLRNQIAGSLTNPDGN